MIENDHKNEKVISIHSKIKNYSVYFLINGRFQSLSRTYILYFKTDFKIHFHL